jgi:hypothetical protein
MHKAFLVFFLFLFGRAASARFARLASGYPLHHLLALRAAQVVPLLSLSLCAFGANEK